MAQVTTELVHSSRILVVHLGRMLPHCPGGAALLRVAHQQTFVPSHVQVTPPTLLQHTLWAATKVWRALSLLRGHSLNAQLISQCCIVLVC